VIFPAPLRYDEDQAGTDGAPQRICTSNASGSATWQRHSANWPLKRTPTSHRT